MLARSLSATKVIFWPFRLFFLDLEGDFEFCREFLWLTVNTMNVDDSTFAVEKSPIAWDECFNDAFS